LQDILLTNPKVKYSILVLALTLSLLSGYTTPPNPPPELTPKIIKIASLRYFGEEMEYWGAILHTVQENLGSVEKHREIDALTLDSARSLKKP